MTMIVRTRALAAALALALAPAAQAFEFRTGGALEGNFDTTVTLGALWRMQERDLARALPHEKRQPRALRRIRGGRWTAEAGAGAGRSRGQSPTLNPPAAHAVHPPPAWPGAASPQPRRADPAPG